MPVTISAAVEGPTDEAVVTKLIAHVGALAGPVYGKNGKPHLRQHIGGYNNAARHSPWIVLVDLDHDADCAPPLRNEWLPQPAPLLCFRVVVRAVEAWLLADAEALSSFLGVARTRVPNQPEALEDPKAVMVNLARQSRRRDIRIDMAPREGSGRPVGPAYASRLIEFVSGYWRPDVAAANADSLTRTIRCLRRIAETVNAQQSL
ncbi:MAG: hypothetical protein RMK99_07380 [Anaerolineales bacterium]|nr:hypothetical protein [Anaerolineales bacterium]